MKLKTFTPTIEDIARYPHLNVATGRCFKNDVYECVVCYVDKYTHLKIHRLDDEPIHDCLDFQHIKNALLGENIVAVEVYPAASDFKDGSNTYHLWTRDEIEAPNLAIMPRYS